ncbi:polysaccharide pyruvyl transferase family protein [Salinimicrobium sp. 3283s]|uniref:polysaccharide pyruvyl transferase family protein n=1 Tax=Salinimicrobium sp. 3283s TaxID=3114359 RepID=UPI0031E5763C
MIYTIISTYPEEGSKNIGDGLITATTIDAIKTVKGENNDIQIVWRGARWEEVKEKILKSDAIIFACLAIRKNMEIYTYPYFEQLLNTNIPLGVIASGTAVDIFNNDKNIFTDFPKTSLEYLKKLNDNALFFTTRGYLTQSFCRYHQLDKVTFSGDIAFFDNRFSNRIFKPVNNIKTIAISDPHKSSIYLKSVDKLVRGLGKLYPKAKLIFMLHGLNAELEKYCKKENLTVKKIYLDKDNGLDTYDDIDLHVGYRVHAHVSSLKRRIPSYLLEQDGRGCDYGLTINKKISVANYTYYKIPITIKNLLRHLLDKEFEKNFFVSVNPVNQLLALIEEDRNSNFSKFLNLEDQILDFNKLCIQALKKLP